MYLSCVCSSVTRSRLPPRNRMEVAVGLSIANTMSPFMGRGAPMTIIKGAFSLGLVREPHDYRRSYLFYAPRIALGGFATSTSGFKYQVTGRVGIGDYSSPGGIKSVVTPASIFISSVEVDYNGFVCLASRYSSGHAFIYAEGEAVDGLVDSLDRAEYGAYNLCNDLGSIVAPEVTIVIHGKLDTLDTSKIQAAGYTAGGRVLKGDYRWVNYVYTWPDGVRMNGWRTIEVHIFDNPQLNGNLVVGQDVKVFWDC